MQCCPRQTTRKQRAATSPAFRAFRAWHRVGPFGDDQMKFKHILGLLCAASMSVMLAGSALGAGQDRQDRRDFSLERQCRLYRRPYQGRARSRDGYHQQRPSRTRQFPAGQECRARRPWRRQGRSGVRRQPGQPRHRTKPGAAADHRREGGRAHRRLSIRHHTDRQRDFRKIRNSLPQRRVGGRQSDRARLQMVFPHNAGRHRLRQNLQRLPQGHEGGRRQDRYGRHGA